MKMVSVALSDLEYAALEQLVYFGNYKNRSVALRAAILMLIETRKIKPAVVAEIKRSRRATRHRPRAEVPHHPVPPE